MITGLLEEVRACQICKDELPLGCRPVLNFSESSKILIIGQAPGTKVHKTGIPWNDASGDLLRKWLDVSPDEFYNPENFAIVPMGFCYPGKSDSGDLPPKSICAITWHDKILSQLQQVKLTLLIGAYSQKYYLSEEYRNVTDAVVNFENFLPKYFPLPHPSPRNIGWRLKHPEFEKNIIPVLQSLCKSIL